MTTQAGFDWVQREVARELKQVPVPFDENRVETPLEEMPVEAVSVVERLSETAVQPLHSGREIRLWSPDDEVIVVR